MLRFVEDLCGVKQGLGGNAAAERAHAAWIRLRVDQRHLHAVVGGVKCGGVASGPGAHHRDSCH